MLRKMVGVYGCVKVFIQIYANEVIKYKIKHAATEHRSRNESIMLF